jgi:signal transduction histidine kinase
MKKTGIAIIIFLSLASRLFAQQDPTDLKKNIFSERDPAQKIDLLLQLCNIYRVSNTDSCLKYALQTIQLIKKSNDSIQLPEAEMFVASYYYTTGSPDSALLIAQKNIDKLKNNPSQISQLAQFYSFSGLCQMKMDQKKDALNLFYAALENAEKCKDYITQLKAYVNIGWVKMELNQFEPAIADFTKAIHFILEKNLPETYSAVVYNNLASCYGSLSKIDSAYKYSTIAIEKARQNNDVAAEANGLYILGTTQEKMGKLDDALQSFLQARPLREKIGDPFYIVSDLAELSSLYAKIGKTQDGIATATKALQIAKENEIDAKLPMIYTALADNYEAEKDFQKAAEVYKKLDALKDSMYADANPKALAEMQAKYETEKKERTIEQQQVRIRTQNFLFAGIVILVVLSGLLIYSLYKRYRLRQETHLKTELMKQQEHAAKAVIEAEEEERQRIAKDLHDGVGQMMSAAKMNLSALESEVQFSDQEQKNSLDKIIQLVDESCKEVRQVSHNMMPNVLMKKNLAAAIADFIDKLDKKKLQVHLYTERLEDRLDSGVETVLYRVIQESVNNVIRHSGATELDISITRDKEGIHATIEDNGSGFDINDKEKREGIGLKNITTRVEYLKGTVDFDSAPGRGTVVGLFIPLTDLKQ